MIVRPTVLEGTDVRLEPLSLDHLAGLCKVGLDLDLWQIATTMIRDEEDMRGYVETALQLQREGRALPFATVDKRSGSVAGSTRFGNIDTANRRMEIGWTWLGRQFQRTHVNTEAKYLMLQHAFDVLGCIRIEFKTDVINEKSRAALKRIGAKEEGVLRKHMITPDGRIRDSVYFSILDTEWPSVKADLQKRLGINRENPAS